MIKLLAIIVRSSPFFLRGSQAGSKTFDRKKSVDETSLFWGTKAVVRTVSELKTIKIVEKNILIRK